MSTEQIQTHQAVLTIFICFNFLKNEHFIFNKFDLLFI
jgi:hypothetical protein